MEASTVSATETGRVSNNYTRPAAVQVRRAVKSYCENVPIINNLNMTVPQGSIYSLLGSSGCGKTTMLSCIVGTLQLDSGDVFVFGNKPGSPGSGIPGPEVGYMPQGLTLYFQLSIMETLQYFGRISGMTEAQISSRSEFLIKFLDLPSPNQRISSLSGGQQRRTSLAVCLLHEPPLLILDEPTVGVDPLLRESIWNHLCEIVQKQNTTVIITTHYIEETRHSATVGIMRNGRLLTEKSPALLLKEHGSNSLEKAILKLCMKDETLSSSSCIDRNSFSQQSDFKFLEKFTDHKTVNEPVIGLSYQQRYRKGDDTSLPDDVTSFRKSQKKETLRNWLRTCKAVFIRNFLTLLRNPVLMYLAFCAPMFHIVLTSGIVGKLPKHIRFGVVDPEINNDFRVCWKSTEMCDLNHLSCGYLELLAESKISPVFIDSVEEALQNVESGNLAGYMAFPQNYSESILNRFIHGRFAPEESLEQSTITFRLDMSNYFNGYILRQGFVETYDKFLKIFVQLCNQTEDAYKVELPFNYRTPVYGDQNGTESISQTISIGVLIVLSYFAPGCTSSYAMIVDKVQGTLDRTMIAGASKTNVMLPYYFTEGFVILVQTALSCFAAIFVFGWEIQGSMFDFISILLLTGISGLAMGIFVAQIVKDLYEWINTYIFLFLVNLYYIGVVWPIAGNQFIVLVISNCFPLSHVLEALRSIIFRGWTATHKHIWPSYGLLIATTLIFFFLSVKFWRVR